MARDENPAVERGFTWYGINPPPQGTPSLTDTVASNEEGKEWIFEDNVWVSPPGVVGARPMRTNRRVKCRFVRNVSGITLRAKALVNLQSTGTDGKFYMGRIDGYASLTAQRCYPLDEFLGASGLPNLDLGWIVIEGPATVRTDLATLAANINVGDPLVSNTAAASTGTTAGRVVKQDLTGATALLGNQLMNYIGRALQAVTTGQTDTDLLIDVGKY